MKLKIEIDCDNAAFQEADGEATDEALGYELQKILTNLATRVSYQNATAWQLHDTNGNHVGHAYWAPK